MKKLTLSVLILAMATWAGAQCVPPPAKLQFTLRAVALRPLLPASGCWIPPRPKPTAMGPKQSSTQAATPPKKSSPGHIFLIIPAYNVSYLKNVPPLSSREKLDLFIEDAYDPTGLAASAVEAGVLEHSHTGFCGYGHGWGGYGKCYGAALLDANISGIVGDYIMPSLLHQDPRFFRLGTGSVGARLLYALSRVFIMRKDSGDGWTFASGPLTGTVVTGAVSNLYYPKADRGWGLSLSRMGIDLGGAAIFNVEAEFWPDILRIVTGKKP